MLRAREVCKWRFYFSMENLYRWTVIHLNNLSRGGLPTVQLQTHMALSRDKLTPQLSGGHHMVWRLCVYHMTTGGDGGMYWAPHWERARQTHCTTDRDPGASRITANFYLHPHFRLHTCQKLIKFQLFRIPTIQRAYYLMCPGAVIKN